MARVFVTGARGFVGRWLTTELESSGHQVIGADLPLDVRDGPAIQAALDDSAADAVVHLAAIAFGPDATNDPELAFSVAAAGTASVLEAVRHRDRPPVSLVVGSADVYGPAAPDELPLLETSPLRGRSAYAVSKLAQESVALAYAQRYGLTLTVARSFNHTGPGQRAEFVVPALAGRVRAVAEGKAPAVPVGNLEVRRDISDVRDVVRAYRLLIEGMLRGSLGSAGTVVNVCSGESVPIRWVAEELCRLARVEPRLEVRPELVRANDTPDVRGDHALLTRLTGWQPSYELSQTLAEVWRSMGAATPAS